MHPLLQYEIVRHRHIERVTGALTRRIVRGRQRRIRRLAFA
jgi:hypothetical protein